MKGTACSTALIGQEDNHSASFHAISALSWYLMQRILAILHRCFGTAVGTIYKGEEFREDNYTRAVRKVSSHFEYLENRSRGLDVTWQPVRRDLIAHP